MKKEITIEVLAALLILLFLYAGFSKWFDIARFRHDLSNQPLPHWMGGLLVWILPASEILTAILLFSERTRPLGFLISTVLLSIFTVYIILGLSGAFHRVPCSCGGVIRSLGWKNHLFFNAFFLLAATLGLRLDNPENRKQNEQPRMAGRV